MNGYLDKNEETKDADLDAHLDNFFALGLYD